MNYPYRVIGALLVIGSCRTLLYTISRDPDIAIFVEMFDHIKKSMFKFFISYIWIFIGWVVAFHVTLGNFEQNQLVSNETLTNGTGVPQNSDSFSDIGSSAVKVLTMFTGELGFDATFAKHVQFKSGKGPFNNYVKRILTIFDHLPNPSKQIY